MHSTSVFFACLIELVEDEQQEKREQEQEAQTRAKKHDERTRKRVQTSMAAELDPLKPKMTHAPSDTMPGPQGTIVDNAVRCRARSVHYHRF